MKRVILTSESVAGLMADKYNASAKVEKHLYAGDTASEGIPVPVSGNCSAGRVYDSIHTETIKYSFARTLPLYLKIVLEY